MLEVGCVAGPAAVDGTEFVTLLAAGMGCKLEAGGTDAVEGRSCGGDVVDGGSGGNSDDGVVFVAVRLV